MAKKFQNALVHGLYARDAVLPWEDPKEFAALQQAVREELNPEGTLEEEAVRDVAELQWRKQRLSLGYLLTFYKDPPPPELTKAAKSGLGGLAQYLQSKNKNEPSRPPTVVMTTAEMLKHVKAGTNSDLFKKEQSDEALVQPRQEFTENVERNVLERAYDPASMERLLKIEAAIDGRIAKVLSRLIGLKEYKKLYGQKTVSR